MRKLLVMMIGLLLAASVSYAGCYSDYDCGYGNKCVKPSGSVAVDGICVTPSNEYGQARPDYGSQAGSPNTVNGCSYDIDCGIRFSCVKRSGELRGICVK